jgi:hypothetical protein
MFGLFPSSINAKAELLLFTVKKERLYGHAPGLEF